MSRTLAQEHALELGRAGHYRSVWQQSEQENIRLRAERDEVIQLLRYALDTLKDVNPRGPSTSTARQRIFEVTAKGENLLSRTDGDK